jgi:hypothetical protein
MSGIFNPSIFNNAAFNVGDVGVAPVKTGTGGIDPEDLKRRHIYKPTGLLERKKKDPVIEQIIRESRDIQREVFDEVIGPALKTELDFRPIETMTASEIDREIGLLMREKVRKDEEEEMLLLMMIAANE